MCLENCTSYLQVGSFRSASTFQWYLILTILRAKYPTEVDVGKTHKLTKAMLNHTCVFVSRFSKVYHGYPVLSIKNSIIQSVRVKAASTNSCIVSIQEYTQASSYPELEILKYSELFKLNASLTRHVWTHMKYWMILRRCCGLQSSKDYRKLVHMSALNRTVGINSLAHKPINPDYPACEVYDLEQVEGLFLNTYLSRRIKRQHLYLEYNKTEIQNGTCKRDKQRISEGFELSGIRKCDRFKQLPTGVRCKGLVNVPAWSLKSCANACCKDPACETWQYCAHNLPCARKSQGCWIGYQKRCNMSAGWISFGIHPFSSTMSN